LYFFGHGTSVGAGSPKALGTKKKGRKESLILEKLGERGVLCLRPVHRIVWVQVQSSKVQTQLGDLAKATIPHPHQSTFLPSSFLKTYLEQAKDTYFLALYFYHFKK
jgi:hypothetical protein